MGETPKHKCIKEKDLGEVESDIRLLHHRVNSLETACSDMSELHTAISVMSLTLDHIVQHNERQDDIQERQNSTLENINENLNRLNSGQSNLSRKVDTLEKRVDRNEEKSTVDLRDLDKEEKMGLIRKYGAPLGIGVGLGTTLAMIILEVLKAIS